MRTLLRLIGVASAAWLAAAIPVLAHGASRGLHLHVSPEPVRPGQEIEVAADAAEPVVKIRIGFRGADPLLLAPDPPAKRVVAKLRAPEGKPGSAINLAAEARTTRGKTLRASAIVVLSRPAAALPGR